MISDRLSLFNFKVINRFKCVSVERHRSKVWQSGAVMSEQEQTHFINLYNPLIIYFLARPME